MLGLHTEIALGPCAGQCAGCFVQKLPVREDSSIPTGIVQSVGALLDFIPADYRVSTAVSSSLKISGKYLPELVSLFQSRLKSILLSVGDSSENDIYQGVQIIGEQTDFFSQNGSQLTYIFEHGGNDTYEEIYQNFSRAINFLIDSFDAIPQGKTLGVGLGRNDAHDMDIWASCYRNLIHGIGNNEPITHPQLNRSIDRFVEKFGRELLGEKFDLESCLGSIHHDCFITLPEEKGILISLQVEPFSGNHMSRLRGFNDNITPLLTTNFVAPMHRIYAINNPNNRMTHSEYVNRLRDKKGGITDYNGLFFS